jgi:hypothetical protein
LGGSFAGAETIVGADAVGTGGLATAAGTAEAAAACSATGEADASTTGALTPTSRDTACSNADLNSVAERSCSTHHAAPAIAHTASSAVAAVQRRRVWRLRAAKSKVGSRSSGYIAKLLGERELPTGLLEGAAGRLASSRSALADKNE